MPKAKQPRHNNAESFLLWNAVLGGKTPTRRFGFLVLRGTGDAFDLSPYESCQSSGSNKSGANSNKRQLSDATNNSFYHGPISQNGMDNDERPGKQTKESA